MNDEVIPLAKPIRAHGGDVSSLTLRAPNVEDMMDIGQPFLIILGDGDTGVRIQQRTVANWIVRLAGIPLSSVKAMDPSDFSKAQAVVLGFFGTNADGQVLS